jgi:hypothetical protein
MSKRSPWDQAMALVGFLVLMTGAWPLWRAWRANRQTSLLHAINWTIGAWAVWCWALGMTASSSEGAGFLARYLALCLTGCAGVAVLGARRPILGPWNFVLLSLLAVLLLPLAQGELLGGPLQLGLPHTLFLAGTLAVTVLNYLPTRMAPAALLLAAAGAGELLSLVGPETGASPPEAVHLISRLLLALVPWVAYARWRRRRPAATEFDRLWLDFRDRFGLVWGQRLRDQFNRAAANAGWPVHLRWRGLRLLSGASLPDAAMQAAIVAGLRALLTRFGPEGDERETMNRA